MRGTAVDEKEDEERDTPIFETHHHLLHGENKQYVIIQHSLCINTVILLLNVLLWEIDMCLTTASHKLFACFLYDPLSSHYSVRSLRARHSVIAKLTIQIISLLLLLVHSGSILRYN